MAPDKATITKNHHCVWNGLDCALITENKRQGKKIKFCKQMQAFLVTWPTCLLISGWVKWSEYITVGGSNSQNI